MSESAALPGKRPCLNSACGSSDARVLYEDGHSFCFSCREWFPPGTDEEVAVENANSRASSPRDIKVYKSSLLEEIPTFQTRGFKERRITKPVAEFFGVKVSYNSDGVIDAHYYPYDAGSYKVRRLPKDFSWLGPKTHKMFGQDKFNSGGKRLIITEGEIDAMSVAQSSMDRYGKVYPVVALPSASATKVLLENRDWIRSFGEVIICFDEDEAGRKATQEAVRVVGLDKVKITKLPHKDANEVLVREGGQTLMSCIFDAAKYIPAGIITKEAIWESLVKFNEVQSVPYPPCLEGMNSKLKGMRHGEITLFISGTGSGKSTILREVMLHVLGTTDEKIGVVSLEESPAETARKLAGMVLKKNPAAEEIPLEELKVGFDKVFGDDRIVLLDHQGSIDDNSIVDQLEYMCLVGCKYLFIDHITILVSEGVADLTGNEAQDKVMNDLLRLVKRHPVWIGLVSHLRKTQSGKSFEEGRLPSIDDIRGSGSIKQISFDIVSFARNMTSTNERERNTIKMRILKSRHTGLTGNVAGAFYDYDTGRLTATELLPEGEVEFVSL